MVKAIFVVIVAVLIFVQGLVSCTPGIQTLQPVDDDQSAKPQSSAMVDNKTMPTKQKTVITPNSHEADSVEVVHESDKIPPQILFLRIDPIKSTKNLYGSYDLTSASRDIWVMDTDGKNAINLTKGSANAMSADWSPDKSKIAFDSVSSYLLGSPVCSISIMDADGGNVKIVSPGATSRHFPAWSPDGNTIANSKYYVRSCDQRLVPCKYFTLFTFSQDGSEDRQLAFSSDTYQILPRWFPDSKRIAFLDNQTGFYEIWSGDISAKADLTKYNIESNPTYMPWFSLSPDATRIAYSHDFSRDYNHTGRELFVFNIATGETTQLTRNDYADDNPCFSPDGKQILFGSFGDNEETRGMFAVNIDGTNLKQISSQYGDIPMQWR